MKNENWPGIRRISLLRRFYFSSLFLALPVGQCTSHPTVSDVAVWVNVRENEKRKLRSPPAAKNKIIYQPSGSPPTVRIISSKLVLDKKISILALEKEAHDRETNAHLLFLNRHFENLPHHHLLIWSDLSPDDFFHSCHTHFIIIK